VSGRRAKRWLGRLALFAVALVLGMLGLEAAVRLLDPYGISHFRDMPRYLTSFCRIVGPPRILRHPPNASMTFRGFSIRTNALGLRGGELAEPKPPGETRVLFLGDSVVLGWGAEEADLFVTRAEQEMNERAPAGRRYRCVNAGHNQYDTVQEAALLDELGERIAPDAVLLVYVANDVEPTLRVFEAFESLQREQSSPSTWQRCTGFLRGSVFPGLSALQAFLAQPRTSAPATGQPPAIDAEGWQRSAAALLRMRDWCQQRSLPFAVLDHTHPGLSGQPPQLPPLQPFLAEAGIARHAFHFTLEELARPIRRSASDPHANRLGHELLLAKLRPALRTLGL
jgi:hypothetical protein